MEQEEKKQLKLEEKNRAKEAKQLKLDEKNRAKQLKLDEKKQSKPEEKKQAKVIIMTETLDEDPVVRFVQVSLINELNLIRNIKVQKKLSNGVKLARQVLDI